MAPSKKSALTYISPGLRQLAIPIEKLTLDPSNARLHPEKNLNAIQSSLKRFGQRMPIVVQKQGMVVRAGNGRVTAARALGWTHIAAVVVDESNVDAVAFAIADNRTAELAEWDEDALAKLLREIGGEVDVQELGFSDAEVAAMIGEATREADASSEPARSAGSDSTSDDSDSFDDTLPKEPTTKPGDVWRLGSHILHCEDSLQADHWKGVRTVDAVFCDPPYAIYGSSTGVASDVTDDKVIVPMFRSLATVIARIVKPFGHVYVCTDWRSYPALWTACRGTLQPKNLCVWDKGGGGLGSNHANTYELVAFLHREPFTEKKMTMAKVSGTRSVHRPNIWRYSRAHGDERLHNAAKPIAMISDALEASTDPGERVGDCFGGSGSVLIACEKIGRECETFEIEPKWCDVIVRRWEKLTGKKAELETTKK